METPSSSRLRIKEYFKNSVSTGVSFPEAVAALASVMPTEPCDKSCSGLHHAAFSECTRLFPSDEPFFLPHLLLKALVFLSSLVIHSTYIEWSACNKPWKALRAGCFILLLTRTSRILKEDLELRYLEAETTPTLRMERPLSSSRTCFPVVQRMDYCSECLALLPAGQPRP